MSASKDWKTVRLGDVAKTSSGGTPKRGIAEYYGGEIPWVKSGELGDGTVCDVQETITQSGLDNSSAKLFPKGTLCIALYGATIGKLGVLGVDATTNQAVCGIFLPQDIDTQYVFHFLASIRRDLIEQGKGGAQPNINQGIIRDIQIPIPRTLAEQQWIVAEIEKQFTRLDAGVDGLKRLQVNLKRYRASVLKAACEGKLVANKSLAEKGNPVAWNFTELGNVVTFAQGLQVSVPKQRFEPDDDDVPFLRIVNYTQENDDFRYIKDPGAKYHIQKDDVVMVRYGNPGFVGRGFEGVIANNLFRVIPQSGLSKDFLFYYLSSKRVADLIRSRQKGGTMQAISFGQLKDIPIGIPPLTEQKRIVEEVERRLSVIEEMEAAVATNLKRATRLRQSILKKAFEGKLI